MADRGEGSGVCVCVGGGGGGFFLKQTEARRAEKKFFCDRFPRPPPPYLRVWMTGPPPLSKGLDPTEKRQWGAKEGMDELNSRSSKCPRSGYFQDERGKKKKMSIPILGKNEALKRVIYNS